MTETEKLFAQLRISTPIKADGLITPNGDIDLSEDQPIEALHNGKVKVGLPFWRSNISLLGSPEDDEWASFEWKFTERRDEKGRFGEFSLAFIDWQAIG